MKNFEADSFVYKINPGIIFYSAAAILTLIIIVALGFSFLQEPDFKGAHREVSEIASAVHAQYQKRPDYWGLNTQKVLEERYLPDHLRHGSRIIGVLGRDITIGSNAAGDIVMPGARQFMISIDNLSLKACQGLLKSVQTAASDPALEKIVIENENGESVFSWTEENALAELPSRAEEICRNRNSISWGFN